MVSDNTGLLSYYSQGGENIHAKFIPKNVTSCSPANNYIRVNVMLKVKTREKVFF